LAVTINLRRSGKTKSLFFVVIILAFIVIALVFGALLTKEFDDIGESSLLKYLVDKEIRIIPIFIKGSNIAYRSHPVNGTSRSLNSIKIKTENANLSHEEAIKYFTKLGYQKDSLYRLSKSGEEISIEDVGDDSILITKYSWK
jgi:regulatory protein YycI of two-component signal transduction system YycFG